MRLVVSLPMMVGG